MSQYYGSHIGNESTLNSYDRSYDRNRIVNSSPEWFANRNTRKSQDPVSYHSEEPSNNETVIIVEPISLIDSNDNEIESSSETPSETPKLFNNDVKLAKAINDSIFGKKKIIDTYKNLKRKLLIIKIEKPTDDELAEILQTKSIGEWQVKCRLPNSAQYIRGVIGPIGHESDLQEVKETLQMKSKNITDVKRIYKGKEKKCNIKCNDHIP